jgi:hypothetical protein
VPRFEKVEREEPADGVVIEGDDPLGAELVPRRGLERRCVLRLVEPEVAAAGLVEARVRLLTSFNSPDRTREGGPGDYGVGVHC